MASPPPRSATPRRSRRRRRADGQDDRPGLRPRRAAPVHRVRPRHRVRGRLPDRGRHGPAPSARPCRRRPRTPTASTASSSRSATTRCGAGAGGCTEIATVDISLSRGPDPGLLAVPQARRLRPRLPPDRVRLGRRDRPDGALRRRVRRAPPAAVRVRVLRRDLLADLAVRERLHELPRAPAGRLLPERHPVGLPAERRDLRDLAGLRDRRPRARSTTRSSARARTGRS